MALETNLPLSIKNTSGVSRNIAQEVDGNNTGNKSLWTLGGTAGLQPGGVAMSEFIGFGMVYYSAIAGSPTCNPYPDVGGSQYIRSYTISITGLPSSNLVNVGFTFQTTMYNGNTTNSAWYEISSTVFKNSVGSGTYSVSNPIPLGSTTLPDQTITLTNINYSDSMTLTLTMYGQENGAPPWENLWSVILYVVLTITPVSGYPIKLVNTGSGMGGQVMCN